MNKCNKTSDFPYLKQHYTKFSFIFIIYSDEKSLSVREYSTVTSKKIGIFQEFLKNIKTITYDLIFLFVIKNNFYRK